MTVFLTLMTMTMMLLMLMLHRCEVPYHAYFVSDRQSTEFQVFPQTGLLPPSASGPGALITIGFVPRSYGRTCVTRLVVQVSTSVSVCFTFYNFVTTLWRGSATGMALDLRSVGRGFKSYSRQRCVTTLGKLFTPMCLCHQAV